jgi:hypothetical protein
MAAEAATGPSSGGKCAASARGSSRAPRCYLAVTLSV